MWYIFKIFIYFLDTAENADKIYNLVNDTEIELSNIKLDLRFVPDDIELPNKSIP